MGARRLADDRSVAAHKTLLVMSLDEATFNAKAKSLGAGSALLVISGYHAELTVTDALMPRRIYRFIFMTFMMSDIRYQTMHDALSFVLTSMIATTMCLCLYSFAVRDMCKSQC